MKKIFTLIILIIISTSAHCNPDDILTYTKKYIAQHNDLDTLIETCNRTIKYADDSLVNIIINDTMEHLRQQVEKLYTDLTQQ